MTKDELLKQLKIIEERKCTLFGIETKDEEQDHIDADNLLLKYINDKDIECAFDRIVKWYS